MAGRVGGRAGGASVSTFQRPRALVVGDYLTACQESCRFRFGAGWDGGVERGARPGAGPGGVARGNERSRARERAKKQERSEKGTTRITPYSLRYIFHARSRGPIDIHHRPTTREKYEKMRKAFNDFHITPRCEKQNERTRAGRRTVGEGRGEQWGGY